MAVENMNYLLSYLLNMNCQSVPVSGFTSEAHSKLNPVNPHTHIGHMDKTSKVTSVRIFLLKTKWI